MQLLEKATSRRSIFKGAAVVGLGMTAAQAGLIRALAQESTPMAEGEDLQTIINIAATAESLAVALYGHVIESAKNGDYDTDIPDAVVGVLVSARAAEQYHLEYLEAAGAVPLTQEFTVPDPALLTSTQLIFDTAVQLETAFIAAYTAAAHRFAELGQVDLVRTSMEVAAVEGEHRVLAAYVAGIRPANNVALAPALFKTVGEAAEALTSLGFIGGTGTPISYPGPLKIDRSSVSLRTPNGKTLSCLAS
ncbi:ferritin-like domain-containing protein [soil metagenome]